MRVELAAALLISACAALCPWHTSRAQQDVDTSWIDWDLIAAGEVDLRTGKEDRGVVTIDVAIAIDSINDGESELFIQTVKPAFFIPKFEHVFRLDYHLPDRIDVRRVSGPIAEMDGTWFLLPYAQDEVLLMHSLRVRPGMPVPRFFVRATLRHDLPIVLRAVRERAEGTRHPGPADKAGPADTPESAGHG